jgi:hypothetical protein
MQKAAQENLILHQIDCEIYMEQPQGFEKESETGGKMV